MFILNSELSLGKNVLVRNAVVKFRYPDFLWDFITL